MIDKSILKLVEINKVGKKINLTIDSEKLAKLKNITIDKAVEMSEEILDNIKTILPQAINDLTL